ncbi:MAG: hypothetical protein GX409_06060, partial [candidate division Zixibacteria bacterium]|nr:hypothetical protein [candidate division Zixibacteria bacterium]
MIGSFQNGELPPSVTINGNDPNTTTDNNNNGADPGQQNPDNATTTASNDFPENTGTIDDWKYQHLTESGDSATAFTAMSGGATGSAPRIAAPAANMMAKSDSIGLAVGGAKDTNNFRENIKNNYLPLETDITYEGLYYSYYFDTGKAGTCEKLFCPSYNKAISKDPFSGKDQ